MNTKKYTILILVLSLSLFSSAQVGINNPLPDPSTVLDLSGGANVGKGLLLPGNSSVGISTTPAPANGLVVMDTVSREFYIFNSDSAKWYSGNPWTRERGTFDITTNKNVFIKSTLKIDPELAQLPGTQTLAVVGNSKFTGVVKADNTPLGKPDGYFEGHGAMPQLSIVMWGGFLEHIPHGWALCDGKYYSADGTEYLGSLFLSAIFPGQPITESTGITDASGNPITNAPDLRGRFIVGYDPADPDYSLKNTGPEYTDADGFSDGSNIQDAKDIKLTKEQLPNHTHNISNQNIPIKLQGANTSGSTQFYSPLGSPSALFPGSKDTDTGNVNNESHENRPPYYTVVFIIKCAFKNTPQINP